jgi:hypothetical protein
VALCVKAVLDGSFALLVGGLVSLQAAVTVPEPPPLDELELLLLLLLDLFDEPPPQALTVSAAATPTVTRPTALLRMAHPSVIDRASRLRAPT